MLTNEIEKARKMFLSVSIIEKHISSLDRYDTYDLCEVFLPLWNEIENNAKSKKYDLEIISVLGIHHKIAEVLDVKSSNFINEEEWIQLLDSCRDHLKEDPEHVISWIFSSIYWRHFSNLKFATAWFYTNALRVQLDLPIFQLSIANIGSFLDSLSASGSPLYDGQTFYPHQYR